MKICAQCKGSFEEGIAYCPTDGSRLTTISKMQVAGQDVPAEAVKHAAEIAAAEGIEDLTGRTIAGRYQISRRLGEGGMGIVYRAVDSRLEKEVAIKVLKGGLCASYRRRCAVHARSEERGAHQARERARRDRLWPNGRRQLLHRDGAAGRNRLGGRAAAFGNARPAAGRQYHDSSFAGAWRSARQRASSIAILQSLRTCFSFQGEDNREIVKIVDFGIAQMKDISGAGGSEGGRKLTRTGMIFGTPEYMSPRASCR